MDWTRPRPDSDRPCKVRLILPDGRTFEQAVHARSLYYAIFAFDPNGFPGLTHADIPREARYEVTGPDGVTRTRTNGQAWDWANRKG